MRTKKLFINISLWAVFFYILLFIITSIYPPINTKAQNIKEDKLLNYNKNVLDTQIIRVINENKNLKKEIKDMQMSILSEQLQSIKQIEKLRKDLKNLKEELDKYPDYIIYTDTVIYTPRTKIGRIFRKSKKNSIIRSDTLWLQNYKL